MGKFMPWGIQMNQLHAKNMVRRAKKGGAGVAIADLAILIGGFGLGGEMYAWLMELLFGKQRGVTTLDEMRKAPLDKATAKALDRLYDDILYTGTLGAVMEAVQAIRGVTTTDLRRTKDLTEPAGIALTQNLRDVIQHAISAKDLDAAKMINDFLTQQVSLYRDGKYAVLRSSELVGLDWDAATLDRRLRERKKLRAIAGRYARDNGLDAPTVMMGGRFLPNEMTPFYTELKDALYLGNVKDARAAAKKVAENTSDRERSWANASQSIRASQPLKVGRFTATDFQRQFMSWAGRTLSQEDLEDIKRVQSTYINTAERAGLLSSGDPQVVRQMKLMMNRKRAKGSESTSSDRRAGIRKLLKKEAGFELMDGNREQENRERCGACCIRKVSVLGL